MTGLTFGPLPDDTLVLCIDMQRLFMEPGDWFCPEALTILPNVEALVRARPAQTLFTRFISADRAETASGAWQRYYTRWASVTVDRIGTAPFNLHETLRPHALPHNVFDKTTHDAFDAQPFADRVGIDGPASLVFCGVETDVCILASVLSAIDLGHRVVLVRDAMASSVPASHDAALTLMQSRFDQQVETVDTAELLSAWGAP
ncbi:isochorismatase family cysteine hydrolase [Acuticoccus sp. MNP-M23]|uniref:cysteine hydrolase family protein n=1 Tax=Acuticoccus sp. MNP-M23 TaxID=3072793 RepID=UPI0028153A67|nr:isochorismatase family cysteine hydrolase [Acuticoccus sp. MNP-M23]WMS43562.1 isochorismatase family cysteine hydrolase [Acuticoccus sp. MNP-M23]